MLLSLPPRPAARARLIPGLSLKAGDVLAGRYRVLSLLRADRICVHLAAVKTSTNQRVDVQILLAMDDGTEAVALQFIADARKATGLDEPHADRVLYVGISNDGNPFVVRDVASGSTIAELIEARGAFATEPAVDIATAVCAALESAHAIGLVHGGISPLVVRAKWNESLPSHVKVADFGTSRALGMLALDSHALASITSHAPEMWSGGAELDARTDVWGVGVLLYSMLAGEPPFVSESPSNLNLDIMSDEPPMLAGVPDELAEIVDACLARDLAKRPQSAAELAEQLARFGANPVLVKRRAPQAVDTGPYGTGELERLVGETDEAKSKPTLQETKTPLVVVPTSSLASTPTPPATTVSTPPDAPKATTPTLPPVALSIAPPLDVEARRSPWLMKALVAAACLTALATVALVSVYTSSDDRPAVATAPLTMIEAPPPLVEPAPPAIALSVLTPMVPPATSASAAPKPITSASPKTPAWAAAAPITAPAPPAPIQPKPKASDDDLRRFLDDRR